MAELQCNDVAARRQAEQAAADSDAMLDSFGPPRRKKVGDDWWMTSKSSRKAELAGRHLKPLCDTAPACHAPQRLLAHSTNLAVNGSEQSLQTNGVKNFIQLTAKYLLFHNLSTFMKEAFTKVLTSHKGAAKDQHISPFTARDNPTEHWAQQPWQQPWYTSRTNSYTICGAAMGQAADPLKLGATSKSFSNLGDTRSTYGGPAKSVRSSAPSLAKSGITLSYTEYANVDDPDQAAEHLSASRQAKVDMLYHFDEEAQHVLELIYNDKDKTFGFEEKKKKKKKKKGIFSILNDMINDILLPPAMRPQWEKEQAALKKEKQEEDRLKKLKAERDWQRAGGLKDDEDEEKTAAARLLKMKAALGEGNGERVEFDPIPVNGYREQGRFGSVPERNMDYVWKLRFKYQGDRFGGQRDGFGTQDYNDGYTYEGDWLLNQREGFGIIQFPDGSVYEGQFYQNKQHGFGVYNGKDGKTYRGSWELGKKHGFGEMPDKKKGLIFSGQWVSGKRHGFGIQLDLKTGNVYAGQWHEGLKHGEGVLKQSHVSLGSVRFRMEWDKGKLIREQPYDALLHGTDVGEAAMWASHYSKECAMDADLAVIQQIPYPEHPVRQKRDLDYVVQQAEDEHAAKLKGEKVEEKASSGDEDRMKVPAPEFRRLISLAHSSDKVVEELILPILDDAMAVEETQTESEHFMVGPIWDENLLKLSHHFATKIQRQWRRCGLKRMVKVAREEARVETDEERGLRMRQEVINRKILEEKAMVKNMEIEHKNLYELQETVNSATVEEDNKVPTELLQKTRQLFRLEQTKGPTRETRARPLLSERLHHRLKNLHERGSIWKAVKPRMNSMISVISLMSKSQQNLNVPKDLDEVKQEIGKRKEEEDVLDNLNENLDLDMDMVKYQDGSRYYGEVHDGLANGYGTLMNPDGSTYAGQHLKGARHGLGVYTVMVGEPEDDLTRIYSGEWLRGLRHGFAIERVMFKKKILKSCVVSNYEFDMKSISENINPGDHLEWLDACDKVEEQGRAAKIEAEKLYDAENEKGGFKATQVINFDWRLGLASYSGQFNEKGQKHGLGIQTWHDGQEYAGEFRNDIPHGGGRESYPDGTWYIGTYQGGRRSGWGRYQAKNGITYIGQWHDGMRHGFGLEYEMKKNDPSIMLWVAFVRFEHNHLVLLDSVNALKARKWLDTAETSVRSATRKASESSPGARIEYEASNKEQALLYVGGCLDSERAGIGVLTHRNGTRYVGEWFFDKKHGLGVENYPDNSYYKGQFNYGTRHGLGEYFDAKSERTYRGHWLHGKRHGRGWERAVMNLISGKIFKEFLIEYEDDKEIHRRFITPTTKLDFVDDVLAMVKRAEETFELTCEIYEDMLD